MRTYFESYFPLLLLMITVPIGHLTHVPAHIPNGCTCPENESNIFLQNVTAIRPHNVTYRRQHFAYTEGTGALVNIMCPLYKPTDACLPPAAQYALKGSWAAQKMRHTVKASRISTASLGKEHRSPSIVLKKEVE
jgi:hypothetical protein